MSEAEELRTALAANEMFYEAFAAGDFEIMEQLWATTTPVLCIHPGHPVIVGREPVLQSWRSVLERPPSMRASDAQAQIIRGVAFVTCLEHIDETVLAATNVFVWERGAWALVHHQAGPVRPLPDAEPGPRGPLH